MTNALITMGVLIGSFSIVCCFAFVIHRMARARQLDRLKMGMAFAMIKREMTRFQGEVKRLQITGKRPVPEQMFELQDYFASKECGSGFEADAIKYTFKTMQLLGYEVKLFHAPKKEGEPALEVDLTNYRIKPHEDIKKEIKRVKKNRRRQQEAIDEGMSPDEELSGDEESKSQP